MYRKIEEEYLKLSPDNDFDKYYKKMSLIVGLVFYFLFLFSDKKILLFVLFIMLLILLSLKFYEENFKKFLSVDEQKLNIIKKVKVYFNYVDNKKRNNLLNILKKQNVNTDKKLELAINYYKGKAPIKFQSGILGLIVSSSITLASLVSIGFNEKTGEMDPHKLAVVLGSTIGILIIVLASILSIKFITDFIRPSRTELYNELENELTYIYTNLESYKDKLALTNKKVNTNISK